MPFKSKAQRRKFAELLVEGDISPEVYERWNRDTGRALLPERVKAKRRKKTAARKKKVAPKKPADRKRAKSTVTKSTVKRRSAKKRSRAR